MGRYGLWSVCFDISLLSFELFSSLYSVKRKEVCPYLCFAGTDFINFDPHIFHEIYRYPRMVYVLFSGIFNPAMRPEKRREQDRCRSG